MKILALEKELPGVQPEQFALLLESEARGIWSLYQSGSIRELYFRLDRSEAVLILESVSVDEARNVLSRLPLVQAGLIQFELIPLIPYPGFSRLFGRKDG